MKSMKGKTFVNINQSNVSLSLFINCTFNFRIHEVRLFEYYEVEKLVISLPIYKPNEPVQSKKHNSHKNANYFGLK